MSWFNSSKYSSIDVDETLETVFTGGGVIYSGIVSNADAATDHYLKVWDALAADVVLGTTTPDLVILLPAGGQPVPFPPCAFEFGCVIAAVEEVAASGTTGAGANEVIIALSYEGQTP